MDWQSLISDLRSFGLSQSEIAKEIGVSRSVVSDIEKGRPRPPSWPVGDKLIKLHQSIHAPSVCQG